MSNMDPVVHFELPAEDTDRMAKFYTSVFGWKAERLGPEMGHYVLVQTAELGEDGKLPKQPGQINGGLFPKTADNQHPTVVIAVEDITEATRRVKEAGGQVLGGQGGAPGEPDDIPGVGLYSAIIDSEGNRIALLQPREMQG
jgi:hypothetical protein